MNVPPLTLQSLEEWFRKPAVRVVGILVGAMLLGSLVLWQMHAERMHDLRAAQFAAISQIVVVIAIVIAIATLRSPRTGEAENDEWLLRLVVVTALGMCVIVLYSVQWLDLNSIQIIGLALLTGGGAWLVGVVVGFLFGIPRLSLDDQHGKQENTKAALGRYRPSTSLEEIADWLTKMIVGVGLTQLNKIPTKLDALASYVAKGMGDSYASHKVLVLVICVYFLSCGFLFGFLWARLYLLKAFIFAESLLMRTWRSPESPEKSADQQGGG